RRHNTLAAAIRDCATAAGWSATCAAGQVFDSHQGRPADVWVERHPKFRAGLAIDCTIVSAAAQDCADVVSRRERRKVDKYPHEVARHPHLGFLPFAVALHGNVGPAATAQMNEWSTLQAARGLAARDFSAARDWVLSTIAHAFATGTLRHIRAYYDRQSADP